MERAGILVTPKAGKDKLDSTNYRPRSVLNLDYKLFTCMLAKRTEKVLLQITNRQTQDKFKTALVRLIRQVLLTGLGQTAPPTC